MEFPIFRQDKSQLQTECEIRYLLTRRIFQTKYRYDLDEKRHRMWALQGAKKAYNGAVCEWWRQVKRSLKKTSSSLERRRFWEWWPSSRCHSIKVCSCLHNPPRSNRHFEHCNIWTGAIVGEDTWMSHHKSPRTEFTFIWRVILWRITNNTDSSVRYFWKPHIFTESQKFAKIPKRV